MTGRGVACGMSVPDTRHLVRLRAIARLGGVTEYELTEQMY